MASQMSMIGACVKDWQKQLSDLHHTAPNSAIQPEAASALLPVFQASEPWVQQRLAQAVQESVAANPHHSAHSSTIGFSPFYLKRGDTDSYTTTPAEPVKKIMDIM